MLLRDADKIFCMANFTRNIPTGNYSLYYLTSFQRQANSLKAGEEMFFGPILVRLLELQRVGLE